MLSLTTSIRSLILSHPRGRSTILLIASLLATACAGEIGPGQDFDADAGDDDVYVPFLASDLTWAEDIRPIVDAGGCTGCHGREGGLSLTTADEVLAGGDSGPVVVLCDPEASLLIRKLRLGPPTGDVMPPTGRRLSEADVQVIGAWINQGAEQGQACPPLGRQPDLLETRDLVVTDRAPVLIEQIVLPPELEGRSALFGVEGRTWFGYAAMSGGLVVVGRDNSFSVVPVGWTGSDDLGDVVDFGLLADDTPLLTTDRGLLYIAEGQLWPSPVTDLVPGSVRFVEVGAERTWFGSDVGLFFLQEERLNEVPETGAVTAMALGPGPDDPFAEALWVAYGPDLVAYTSASGVLDAARVNVELPDATGITTMASDEQGNLWAATPSGVLRRRPGALWGVPRWVYFKVAEGEVVGDLAVGPGGVVWLRTNEAVYVTLDGIRWSLAVGAPAADVVGLAPSDGDGVWLTRARRLERAMVAPLVAVSGVRKGATLDFLPDLTVHPAFPQTVTDVTISVDGCPPQTLDGDRPWVLTGAGLLWADCLANGARTLTVTVDWSDLGSSRTSVPFTWLDRPDNITWANDIEPVFASRCALTGCHNSEALQPFGQAGWQARIEDILFRVDLPSDAAGRMPPSGDRLREEQILLIRWWRDDGFP